MKDILDILILGFVFTVSAASLVYCAATILEEFGVSTPLARLADWSNRRDLRRALDRGL